MSDSTKIQWTDTTWNPVTGCTKVSAGCKNCYAEALAPKVFAGQVVADYGAAVARRGNPQTRPRRFTDVRTHPDRLDKPLRWRKPRRVFVASMSDLFHEDVPDEFIDQVFGVMALSQYVGRCRRRECDHDGGSCDGYVDPPTRHQFQVLTKRPERARRYLSHPERPDRVAEGAAAVWHFSESALDRMEWPLPNIWLGVSCEDQPTADERIPLLLDTPAAVRFVSAEPLLGPIEQLWPFLERKFFRHPGSPLGLARNLNAGQKSHPDADLDWVIVGGESGRNARPCDLAWIRSIVEQCQEAGVPCFVKQLGAKVVPDGMFDRGAVSAIRHAKGGDPAEWPEDLRVREWPAAGWEALGDE